ncbi:MAG: hypothetical protein H6718_17655 [Polyangiaceae bacterium]|nr:hypothetical protein [Polyangiaceae bacterium]MCB9609388.1 hypothetical protein [Polyangiaceae bacterium]
MGWDAWSRRAALAYCLVLSGVPACKERAGKGDTESHSVVPAASHVSQPKLAPKPTAASSGAPTPRPTASEASEPINPPEEVVLPSGWVLDELADVAPAGPATATMRGVVMVTRDNAVHFATYQPHATTAPAGESRVAALPLAAEQLVSLRRGPALLGSYAYWIDGKRLLRRLYAKAGELETLAEDARHSTRVAAPPELKPGEPALVAYVSGGSKIDSELKAHLWVEGSGTLDVSDEAASANSVAITRASTGLVVLSLEARTGMTPIHARGVSFEEKRPKLGEDLVVWVGGPVDPLTEIVGASGAHLRLGFVATNRTATEFGLATLNVGDKPRMGAQVRWVDYPNGLDPAPVATAQACGRPIVIFVRPTTAAVHALQELRLGFITADGVGDSFILARSRGFANVSIAGGAHGALVAYTADRRTWARALRCK